jgi:hypothetical protein
MLLLKTASLVPADSPYHFVMTTITVYNSNFSVMRERGIYIHKKTPCPMSGSKTKYSYRCDQTKL